MIEFSGLRCSFPLNRGDGLFAGVRVISGTCVTSISAGGDDLFVHGQHLSSDIWEKLSSDQRNVGSGEAALLKILFDAAAVFCKQLQKALHAGLIRQDYAPIRLRMFHQVSFQAFLIVISTDYIVFNNELPIHAAG